MNQPCRDGKKQPIRDGDCEVTAVRLNNRSNASGEWEDFFNFVPNKKDSVAVVKAGETALIDDFSLDAVEF